MHREINPSDFPAPQSNYSQGVAHNAVSERLVISGQVAVRPDGSVAEGLEAQMQQTWDNFLAVLQTAGFDKADVVKVTLFTTVPALAGVSSRTRGGTGRTRAGGNLRAGGRPGGSPLSGRDRG